jgi:hypothetical protein
MSQPHTTHRYVTKRVHHLSSTLQVNTVRWQDESVLLVHAKAAAAVETPAPAAVGPPPGVRRSDGAALGSRRGWRDRRSSADDYLPPRGVLGRPGARCVAHWQIASFSFCCALLMCTYCYRVLHGSLAAASCSTPVLESILWLFGSAWRVARCSSMHAWAAHVSMWGGSNHCAAGSLVQQH